MHVSNHYYYNCFTALWISSWTTRVSRYQKKHSSAYAYLGRQSSLSAAPSITIHDILPVQFMCLTAFFHNLCPSFLWSTSWPGTLTSYSIHFFTQSLCLFRSTCPYHRNLFSCSTEIMSPNPSLSTLYLELCLVA